MFNSRSIRTPLLAIVVLSSMIMLAGGIIALWSLAAVAGRFNEFVERDQARLQAYNGMYAQGLQTGQAIRNIILDPANPKAFKNLEAAQQEFGQHLASAQQLAADTAEAGLLTDIEKRWAANTQLKNRIRDLAKAGQHNDAVQVLNKEETISWREIKDILLQRGKEQASAVAESKRSVEEQAARGKLLTVLAFLVAFAVTGTMVTMIVGRLRQPLLHLEESMRQLESGDGDLTRRLPVETRDEAGRTALSFNNFLSSLQTTIAEVQVDADEVARESAQVASAVASMSQASGRQAEASAAIAAAIEELVTSIESVAASAQSVKETSDLSLHQAEQGTRSIAALRQEVDRIDQSIRSIAQVTEQFVTKSRTITDLTGEVKDIADQTNLLALNAAIEAARAGEHGRGFAVVADEVRGLAEKSGKAAAEINDITQGIRNESGNLENAVRSSVDILAEARASLDALSGVLHESTAVINREHLGIDEINNALLEQKAAGQEIGRNLESIARTSEQTSHATGETASSAERLQTISALVRASVGRFRV
jgi:methyl-accepting chemotaxis protein